MLRDLNYSRHYQVTEDMTIDIEVTDTGYECTVYGKWHLEGDKESVEFVWSRWQDGYVHIKDRPYNREESAQLKQLLEYYLAVEDQEQLATRIAEVKEAERIAAEKDRIQKEMLEEVAVDNVVSFNTRRVGVWRA